MKFKFSKQQIKKLINSSILKKKDSFLGIPLLFTLTGFSSIRQVYKLEVVNRIALLKITSTRDTIFTIPAIKALRKAYPNALITYFTGEDNFNIASEIKEVTNAVRLFNNDISKSIKIVRNAGRFDLWIDFGAWSRFEAILSHSSKSKYKLGFKTDGEHRHFAYDKVVDYSFNLHESLNYANLLSSLYIDVNNDSNIEEIDLGNLESANDTDINHTENKPADEKLVVIDIFSDNEYQSNRKYSKENWKAIVAHLNKAGYKVALLGDKKDVEEAEVFNELAGGEADIDFCVGRLDFQEKLKLISSACLIIAGDNTTLHLSAFLKKKAIGLYGPTDKNRYSPISNDIHIISSYGCYGCQNIYGDEKCTMEKPDCMESIPVTAVINKMNEILGLTNIE